MWRVIGILFVIYPLIRIAGTPTEPIIAAAALAATGLFAVLTFSLGRRHPDDPLRADLRLAAADLAITALAAFTVVRTPDQGWIVLFYYASTAASLLLPDRRALVLIAIAGGVTAACLVPFTDLASALVQGLAVSIIGVTVFAMAALRRTNAQLYAARQELAQLAVAEERDRIARDLHDTLGHSLSLIAIKSELAGRLLPDDPARARDEIADVERVARESLASVRATVRGDHRPTLDGELANARVALEAAGIEATIERDEGPLPASAEMVLAWAVREAVTNVVRHSVAAQATVRVRRVGDQVRLEVLDDGVGAVPAPAADRVRSGEDEGGSGLRGLEERVKAIDGTLDAGPGPDGGYRVTVSVRVATPTAAEAASA
jgi:two-component system sensor histidine kinase DesK